MGVPESKHATKSPYVAANGLDDVVATATHISHVFGEEGRLVYRGYEINQLAGKVTYEEVCHLLWKGHLPTRTELGELDELLRMQRTLPEAAVAALRALPESAEPMNPLPT